MPRKRNLAGETGDRGAPRIPRGVMHNEPTLKIRPKVRNSPLKEGTGDRRGLMFHDTGPRGPRNLKPPFMQQEQELTPEQQMRRNGYRKV